MLEPNSEYQYYHNHIFDQGIAFVPQMGAFAVWGGNVPNKNPYNAAHTRGSPMYTSKHFSVIDVRRFGFVDAPLGYYNMYELARANSKLTTGVFMPPMSADEMFAERVAREHRELQKLLGDENETRDGIKSIEFIGRVLIEQEARVTEEEDDDGFSRDAPIKSYEQDCCEDAAPNCLEVPSEVPKEHIRIDDEDGFRRPSSEPTILPPRPKERVPLQYLEGDAKSDFRRYGMPAVTKGSVFEMVNCSFQPRMRYGHQMFVHRTRVLITGGRLSYADDDEVGELPPAVFDLSNREWKEPARWRDSEGRDIDARTVTGSRIFRAAYTQMFRHSSDDEATCFMWGGIDENVEGGRENTNLLIGWIKPKPVEPPNLSMRPPAVSLVEPLFHFEALPIAEGPRPEWELGTFQSKPTAANEVRKGAFLVALNMMPPPSRLEYIAMKEGTARHAGSESHLDTVWEVLFLFKSNGEVWELPLSARAIRDQTLRWRRTTLHFGLPASLATVDDNAAQQPGGPGKNINKTRHSRGLSLHVHERLSGVFVTVPLTVETRTFSCASATAVHCSAFVFASAGGCVPTFPSVNSEEGLWRAAISDGSLQSQEGVTARTFFRFDLNNPNGGNEFHLSEISLQLHSYKDTPVYCVYGD